MRAVDRATFGPIHHPIRGLLHGAAGAVWAAIALRLLLGEPVGSLAHAAVTVFAATQAGLFLVSASYHSLPWSPRWKRRMQRVDHAMIAAAIAGALTPLVLLGCPEPIRVPFLVAVWACAALGVAHRLLRPFAVRGSIRMLIAQAALAAPALLLCARPPGAPLRLALLGGACYALGAACFVTQRPRLWPRVFSHHELFHVLVVAGSMAIYAFAMGWLARLS